ncbi:AcrR family transcriptional regulator [Streptomyces umbrinus]|uniref:TetR/AcrR family transcriptional regulator n=1 Tax=Streptomyces umbrinus TaxID=67370 RepID=UPI0019B15D64|nr:TetR/AcrR family transcriptional regulator [Streptomyces umbrinus]MCR3731936.1 AcrR family transcriptional regulator [Streptomyces umbrinus]GHH66516.1 TetR family transcriptional regulator [Streptomyces umbrinus]
MTTDTAAPAPAPEMFETSEETTKASSRDRLLDTAADLCYRQGLRVPTDTLCKAAGISKRSMYKLFDSKDAVLAAALERSAPGATAHLMPPDDCELGPRARMLYVFERLEEAADAPNYRGCPYTSAQVELKDPAHPASVVAARAKRQLLDFFRAEAAQAGAIDPGLLARQLTVVYDGASTRAGIGADCLRGLAVTTASALIDVAGIVA